VRRSNCNSGRGATEECPSRIKRGAVRPDAVLVNDTRNGSFGGRLSAVLYLLCAGLVAIAVPFVPAAPRTNQAGLLAAAAVALAAGCVIWVLPWGRWPAASTL